MTGRSYNTLTAHLRLREFDDDVWRVTDQHGESYRFHARNAEQAKDRFRRHMLRNDVPLATVNSLILTATQEN